VHHDLNTSLVHLAVVKSLDSQSKFQLKPKERKISSFKSTLKGNFVNNAQYNVLDVGSNVTIPRMTELRFYGPLDIK